MIHLLNRAFHHLMMLLALGVCSLAFNFPYSQGPYKPTKFKVTPLENGSPLITTGFYPQGNGTFHPIFFVGGVAGVIPSEAYTDLLMRVASHGYIVMGMDRFPIMHASTYPVSDSVEKFILQTRWLRHYINASLRLDWNQPIAMCHSEGCDVILKMILNSTDIVKAALFLDPFSITSTMVTGVPTRIPSLSLVSQLSEIFPGCCVKGFGYRQFYKLMHCPKVKANIKDFGHCDLLDDTYWKVCHDVGVCQTTNVTRNSDYKDFLTGITTSFIQWTIDGKTSMSKYVINTDVLPLPVTDLAYNETCVSQP